MPDFLAKAACRGRRPQHLAARRIFPRPDLIAFCVISTAASWLRRFSKPIASRSSS